MTRKFLRRDQLSLNLRMPPRWFVIGTSRRLNHDYHIFLAGLVGPPINFRFPIGQSANLEKPVDDIPASAVDFSMTMPRLVKGFGNLVGYRLSTPHFGYQSEGTHTEMPLAAVLGTKFNLKLLSVCYLVCLYCVHMFIVMVKYYQEFLFCQALMPVNPYF